MKAECWTCGPVDEFKIHGYDFGDRLLEGAMFTINKEGKASIQEEDEGYFAGLNKEHWCKMAARIRRAKEKAAAATKDDTQDGDGDDDDADPPAPGGAKDDGDFPAEPAARCSSLNKKGAAAGARYQPMRGPRLV